MKIVEWLKGILVGFGAAWVMWLLIGLSIISVAVMLERAWFFWSIRDNLVTLAQELRTMLRRGDIDAALARMRQSPSAEAAVVIAGLMEADRGPKAAEEAMRGAAAVQRMRLERRLAYLGTLGNNAPFLGLFGTVIGVVMAFEELGKHAKAAAAATAGAAAGAADAASSLAPQAVMSSIAEALVATAVGLAVAIPAVAAYNFFQRQIRSRLANTDTLSCVLLSYLYAVEVGTAPRPSLSQAEVPSAQPRGRSARMAVQSEDV